MTLTVVALCCRLADLVKRRAEAPVEVQSEPSTRQATPLMQVA